MAPFAMGAAAVALLVGEFWLIGQADFFVRDHDTWRAFMAIAGAAACAVTALGLAYTAGAQP